MRRATTLALAIVLASFLAACGGSSSSESTGSTDTSGATADPGTVTSDMPTMDPGAGGGMTMGGDSMGDAELDGRIPTTVDGQAISVAGTDFSKLPAGLDAATMFAGGDTMSTWLQDKGKTWRDVSIVSAMTEELIATSPDTKTALLTGIRVKGADADGLFEWFTGSSNTQAYEQSETKQIGSHSVSYWGVQGITGAGMYVWSEGDTVYWVTNANPESFAEAFISAIK